MNTILVIDDNEDISENTAEILTLAGYKTFTAENGKIGVEVAMREKPDVIVCDIMMPVLDGYGVLHLLNKNEDTRGIPFIFLSAKTERSDLRKGMEMGADDYITKPFEEVELLNAIQTRLKKKMFAEKQYPEGAAGLNSFIRDLRETGLVKHLTQTYEVLTYGKKQTLYQEGKRPRHLFYLVTGKVKSVKNNEDGKEYITNLLTAGDFIGYIPIIEDKNYDDTTIAIEESEVLQVPKDDFLNIIYSDTAITTKFMKMISQNVRDKEERLLTLAYSSLRKRVARALVDIDEKFAKAGNTRIAISREDIAHYVGTATESLIRTLSDFKAEKLIDISDGKITVAQKDKLKNLLY
jgi:CRP-like cAMP-binding protein/CheY-like chemotaxis protein